MKFKHLRNILNENLEEGIGVNTQQLALLMRNKVLKPSEIGVYRNAMRRLSKVNDVARLSLRQRQVHQKVQNALIDAGTASTSAIQAVRSNLRKLQNSFEITDKEQISEATKIGEGLNPPYMLVLRRTGVRIFPDGKRVALYVNERLGLTFSVPYTPTGSSPKDIISNVQAEEVELNEENIDENIEHIKNISRKGESKELRFLDGSSLKVDHQTAKAIHLVHDALNDENKAKVAKMLSHSKGQFLKVADFANKNTAYRIGKHS